MITLRINGLPVSVEEGTTLLEAAQFIGFPIPTLCHMEGLTPYGACRLCVVEIGEGARAKLVSSCTYRVEEGLQVRTTSSRVLKARKMILNFFSLPVLSPKRFRIWPPPMRSTTALSSGVRRLYPLWALCEDV